MIAPVPMFDYSNPEGPLYRRRDVPFIHSEESLEVYHPRWFFPPGGTPLNVVCMLARLFFLIRKLRKERRFDVIDAHFGYPEGVVGALLAQIFRVPVVITLRGSELLFASQYSRRIAMRWALRHADGVVTVSEELRTFAIREGVPPEKAVVIANGVDREIFYLRDVQAMRSKKAIPEGSRVIVSAGELIEAKGHQHVAEAVRDLVAEGFDIVLVIVGGTARGGPRYEATLKETVERLGLKHRVQFAGRVGRDEIAELLSMADVFCLASYTEGWPNVVHEAMACGTPVVATRVGAIPEMLPSNDLGIIIPVKDQAALLAALREALERNWDRMSIASQGGERTWNHVSRQVLTVFRQIVSNSTSASENSDLSALLRKQ
jgi:glycosyltransferase involved in cell wall biosynthesis